MATCANNCNNCSWMEIKQPGDGHCYMLRDEPDGVCGLFDMTAHAKREIIAIADGFDDFIG